MNKERIGLDLDIPDFDPPAQQRKMDTAQVQEVPAHHAPAAAPADARRVFDARSLRRSNRTAKLNIATSEETRQRFWMLAQRIGLTSGEETLIVLLDAFEAANTTR
ncbi:hypothetical protein [Ensifer soli]|uniref:hypothetical protein n=1 Tax=Ciceribacter sp. sgz301302 TaxID=3342379 RepID=UPI0035BA28FE